MDQQQVLVNLLIRLKIIIIFIVRLLMLTHKELKQATRAMSQWG